MDDPLAQSEQRVQLALLEGLQEEALRRIGTGESGQSWSELRTVMLRLRRQAREVNSAAASGDGNRAGELARDLLRDLVDNAFPIFEQGYNEEAARKELVKLFKDRASLIRVHQQGKKTVPIETLAVLQARFAYLVTKYVADKKELSRLVAELRDAALPGWAQSGREIEGMVANDRN